MRKKMVQLVQNCVLMLQQHAHIIKPPPISAVRGSLETAFGKYLLITNTLSTGVLMSAGDVVQQSFEQKSMSWSEVKYDWRRNRNMFVVGLIEGPLTTVFYTTLDKFLPGNNLKTIARKILCDQLIASPVCILTFFTTMNYLSGHNWEHTQAELKEKVLTVYVADWCVWPPSQFINFYCLPTKYRVIYVSMVTMLYNVFLSYIKHRN